MAEAAELWSLAGEPDRAEPLARRVAGDRFEEVPRDVDFLLVVTSVVDVAAALSLDDVLVPGIELLEPYAGRAVLNAGAVVFRGVVEDHLHRAHLVLGSSHAERWRHAAVTSYRRLGASRWEARLGELPAPRVLRPVTIHLHPHTEGVWLVGASSATRALATRKGFHHLRHLLGRPGVGISALALSDAAAGHPGGGVAESDGGKLLDAAAAASYRQRLAELDVELDQADAWADTGRRLHLEDERDALLGELRTAIGLGGRRRRATSANERARVAVRKAVAAAIGVIANEDDALGRLLRATIRTGSWCRYEPDVDRPVQWVLDPPAR